MRELQKVAESLGGDKCLSLVSTFRVPPGDFASVSSQEMGPNFSTKKLMKIHDQQSCFLTKYLEDE